MDMWEYTSVLFTPDPASMARLNGLGSQRWELVRFAPNVTIRTLRAPLAGSSYRTSLRGDDISGDTSLTAVFKRLKP
jgi:hypothetical protein